MTGVLAGSTSAGVAATAATAQPQPNTYLDTIPYSAPSMGKPTSKIIEEIADRWAFLVRVLDMSS